MLDPIDSLSRVMLSNVTNPRHSSGSEKAVSGTSDHVDVPSPDSALNSFRTQIGALENELPGMIRQSIQAPAKEGASNEALNAVVFRLTDPLNFILKGNHFTKEQLNDFQKEVSKFRDEVMGMIDQAVSTPSAKAKLNNMVSRLANHLDGVSGQIQNKILSV